MMKPVHLLMTFAMGMLLWTSFGVWAAQKATAFEVAMAEVTANIGTPEGARYDQKFGPWLAEHHADTMMRCTKSAKPKDPLKFDLLVRVSGEGKAEEVLVKPETTVARCLAEGVRKGALIRPPRPSYWVRVEMSIRP